MSSISTVLAFALGGALFTPALAAAATQTTLEQAAPSGTVEEELLQMASKAGVIFAGEVLGVTPHTSFAPASGFVEVTFRIDQPIRGCDGQSTYTLREWSGLWTGGRQRYTPGQRLLVLLHAPSASGLSSPVGGQDGIIPIVGTGPSPKPTDVLIAQADPAVDLRWVQARLPRVAMALPSSHLHASAIANTAQGGRERAPLTTRKSGAMSVLRSIGNGSTAIEGVSAVPLSSASHGISLRSILAILGTWQAQQNDAPR